MLIYYLYCKKKLCEKENTKCNLILIIIHDKIKKKCNIILILINDKIEKEYYYIFL